MKKEDKKYCIWDNKLHLEVKSHGKFTRRELENCCKEFNKKQPNRYEVREIK